MAWPWAGFAVGWFGLLRDGGFDGADDGGGEFGFVGFDDDLLGDFAAVDFDVSWEVEGDADAFALDGRDADHADGVLGVADDDFFAFTSCDDQHPWLHVAPNFPWRLCVGSIPLG